MGQSNIVHQREVIWTLATGTMSYEVEFRYCNPESNFVKVDVEGWEVSCKTTTKIDAPLAGNIICDENIVDTQIEVVNDGRRKGIVSVDVPVVGEGMSDVCVRRKGAVPFTTLKVSSTVAPNKRMPARRNHDPGGEIATG